MEVRCVLSIALKCGSHVHVLSLGSPAWSEEDVGSISLLALFAAARADRSCGLPLLHVVDAALSNALLIEVTLAVGPVPLEASQTYLGQARALTANLGLLTCFSDRNALELDRVGRVQDELADIEVEDHLLLAVLDSIDHFIANQRQHALNYVRPAVAHFCNGLEAGRHELFLNNLSQ